MVKQIRGTPPPPPPRPQGTDRSPAPPPSRDNERPPNTRANDSGQRPDATPPAGDSDTPSALDPAIREQMLMLAGAGIDPYDELGLDTPDTERSDEEWEEIRDAVEFGYDPSVALGEKVSEEEILEATIDNLLSDNEDKDEDEEEEEDGIFATNRGRTHADGSIGM
jgi:hypothetical protein